MITIKLTTEYPQVAMDAFTPNRSLQWGDCQFVVNQDIASCDYWMVIDGLLKPEMTVCPPENVFLFTAEPPAVRRFGRTFLKQFATVVTCQRELKHPHVLYSSPPLPWYMKATYEEVITRQIAKTETMMIITSNKQMTDGHRKRYEFALKLKAHFGDAIQLYGRGIQEINDKWDVLVPHRYAVVVENSRSIDYLSEKLTDCFLTETFPFYSGCPNIYDYFSKDALEAIHIDNFDQTVRLIEQTIADASHYERHLQALREAKTYYLQQYSIFAILSRYAVPTQHEQDVVRLSPESPKFSWNNWGSKLKAFLRTIPLPIL